MTMHTGWKAVAVLAAAAGLAGASGLAEYHIALAQAPAPAPSPSSAPGRIMGSLVKVDGQKLTLKDQQGAETTVTLSDSTKLLQIAPGQTSLSSATPIQLTDIQPGDRLLVRVQPAPDGSGPVATVLVAMKQAAISQQHESVLAAWQHGVGGLVKQVDPANQTIEIATNRMGHPATMTIKLTPSTIVKRYAAQSVQYDQAKPSSLAKILVGDQLRARGTAGSDPSTFQADEVVAGSFRNISGRITAVDPATGMVSLIDLATRQPLQLKVTSDSQLRKLDDATAERLAAAMKPAGEGAGGRPGGGPPSGGPPATGGAPAAGNASSGGEGGQGGYGHRGAQGGGSAGDMQQALAHAAPVQIAELKKGELVMAVASSGTDNQLGAVTMVTGVEPLLRASPSASAAGLSSWSLGGGSGGEQQ